MTLVPEWSDARLYDLLEAGCEQASASVRLAAQRLEPAADPAANLTGPTEASAKIADEILARLFDATVTSLPKAEVEALSRSITAIPVAAARFVQRWDLAAGDLQGLNFKPPLDWIEEMTELLRDMTRQLRGFDSLDRIKELHPRLEKAADHAETQVQAMLTRSYQSPANPLSIVKVKDLTDQLTEIVDRCRTVGRIIHSLYLRLL